MPSKKGKCRECIVRDNDEKQKILSACSYCQDGFCDKHLPPRLAFMRSFFDLVEDKGIKQMYETELRKPDGHPDWDYSLEYQDKLKQQKELSSKAFDKLLNSGIRKPKKSSDANEEFYQNPPNNESVNLGFSRDLAIGLLVGGILSFIIFSIIFRVLK